MSPSVGPYSRTAGTMHATGSGYPQTRSKQSTIRMEQVHIDRYIYKYSRYTQRTRILDGLYSPISNAKHQDPKQTATQFIPDTSPFCSVCTPAVIDTCQSRRSAKFTAGLRIVMAPLENDGGSESCDISQVGSSRAARPVLVQVWRVRGEMHR